MTSRGWWLRLAWCSWAWKREMAVGVTVLLVWSVCYRSTSIQVHPSTRYWNSANSDNPLAATRTPYGDRPFDEGASKIIKSVMDIKPVDPNIPKPLKSGKKRINLKNAEIEKHIKANKSAKKRRVKGKKAKKSGAKPKSPPVKASEHRDPNADRHDVRYLDGREGLKQADQGQLRSAAQENNNVLSKANNVLAPADQYTHPLGRNPFPGGAQFDDTAIRRMPKQSDYPMNMMSSTSPSERQVVPSSAPALVVPPLGRSGTSTSGGLQVAPRKEDVAAQGSTKKIEYEDQASFMNRMKEVMTSRRSRVTRACQEHRSSLMRFNNYKRLLWDAKHHLAYCRNAKAGTTTWLKDLLQREGVDTKGLTSEEIHNMGAKRFPPLSPRETEKELSRSVAFTVVRHPFVRLVSAYRDKFPEMYRMDIQREIMQRYRNITYPQTLEEDRPPSPSYEVEHNEMADDDVVNGRLRRGKNVDVEERDLGEVPAHDDTGRHSQKTEDWYDVDYPGDFPTFREFALYVTDEIEKCEPLDVNSACLQDLDVHWMPFFERCAPCDIHYDVIAKMETFEDDMRYIKLLANLTDSGPMGKEHASDGVSTNTIAQDFLAALTMEERERLYYAFNFDFLLFGYLPDVF